LNWLIFGFNGVCTPTIQHALGSLFYLSDVSPRTAALDPHPLSDYRWLAATAARDIESVGHDELANFAENVARALRHELLSN
jgi:hypothetical protein